MSLALKISQLSKKYLIYHEMQGNVTLVETLAGLGRHYSRCVTHFFRGKPLPKRNNFEEFWALKDIDLEIQEGDRVGIIGQNGAGKSTLLKLISRITEPTSGNIQIRGRVASLLEVGTGFHIELTGRENIFLNGAVLGMKKREIEKKFDEIVAFSGVEKFLDTPIKRYSSGMLTRLGFAVAAHLDPDILIVDEVLAVGDLLFQEKCLKKLNELGDSGRTILFVSHNIASILALCNKGVYLENGQLVKTGTIDECVNDYLKKYGKLNHSWEGDVGDEHMRIFKVSFDHNSHKREYFYQHEHIQVEIETEVLKPSKELILGISIWDKRNRCLAQSYTFDGGCDFTKPGLYKVTFPIDASVFHEGEYFVKVDSSLFNRKSITQDEIVLNFSIYSQEKKPLLMAKDREGIFLGSKWKLNRQ